jgi:DNA-binding MarR family transcriptional regulator
MEQLVGLTELEVTELHKIYKVLRNEGRLKVYLYLKRTKAATCSIIAKRLGLSRSVVSKHCKELVRANLVVREKWFKTIVFKPQSCFVLNAIGSYSDSYQP